MRRNKALQVIAHLVRWHEPTNELRGVIPPIRNPSPEPPIAQLLEALHQDPLRFNFSFYFDFHRRHHGD